MNAQYWGKLQKEADRLDANAMCRLCDRWVYLLAPLFNSHQRQAAGLYYQYFFSQVEHCHNLIFKRSVGLSHLFDRIIDRSRNVGRPDPLATFFGTKTYRSQRGKLQTKTIDQDKAHPVIKMWYKKGWIKQYEKEGRLLRTECTVNNTYDVGVQRSLRNLLACARKWPTSTGAIWSGSIPFS